jgi:hypothetical protein
MIDDVTAWRRDLYERDLGICTCRTASLHLVLSIICRRGTAEVRPDSLIGIAC